MSSDLAWMRPRLAELCGLQLSDPMGFFGTPSRQWRPDEDVAQAIQCVPPMNDPAKQDADRYHFTLHYFDDGWLASFERRVYAGDPDEFVVRGQKTPDRAICLAIAAALGWEAPTNNGGTT